MAWYEVSMDELMHNEQQKMVKVTEKRQKAITLVDMMLSYVLSQLGVDVTLPDEDIREQQLLLGIEIQEMDEQQLAFIAHVMNKTYNSKCLGFYISRLGEPMAFVSDPYVGKDGVVRCAVEPYNDKIKFNEANFMLAQ